MTLSRVSFDNFPIYLFIRDGYLRWTFEVDIRDGYFEIDVSDSYFLFIFWIHMPESCVGLISQIGISDSYCRFKFQIHIAGSYCRFIVQIQIVDSYLRFRFQIHISYWYLILIFQKDISMYRQKWLLAATLFGCYKSQTYLQRSQLQSSGVHVFFTALLFCRVWYRSSGPWSSVGGPILQQQGIWGMWG